MNKQRTERKGRDEHNENKKERNERRSGERPNKRAKGRVTTT